MSCANSLFVFVFVFSISALSETSLRKVWNVIQALRDMLLRLRIKLQKDLLTRLSAVVRVSSPVVSRRPSCSFVLSSGTQKPSSTDGPAELTEEMARLRRAVAELANVRVLFVRFTVTPHATTGRNDIDGGTVPRG